MPEGVIVDPAYEAEKPTRKPAATKVTTRHLYCALRCLMRKPMGPVSLRLTETLETRDQVQLLRWGAR
jgi:hypothetical protein